MGISIALLPHSGPWVHRAKSSPASLGMCHDNEVRLQPREPVIDISGDTLVPRPVLDHPHRSDSRCEAVRPEAISELRRSP